MYLCRLDSELSLRIEKKKIILIFLKMVRKGLFKTLAIGKSQYGKAIGLNSKHGKDSWGSVTGEQSEGVSE